MGNEVGTLGVSKSFFLNSSMVLWLLLRVVLVYDDLTRILSICERNVRCQSQNKSFYHNKILILKLVHNKMYKFWYCCNFLIHLFLILFGSSGWTFGFLQYFNILHAATCNRSKCDFKEDKTNSLPKENNN